MCVDGGKISVALLLFHYGAHVNVLDFDLRSPLHAACSSRHAALFVPLFLRFGADTQVKQHLQKGSFSFFFFFFFFFSIRFLVWYSIEDIFPLYSF